MFEIVRLSPAFLIRPSGPPSPRGKGSSYCFLLLGVRWYAVGLGRCGHRPLRIGGGTYLYRKSAYRPHSSSTTASRRSPCKLLYDCHRQSLD